MEDVFGPSLGRVWMSRSRSPGEKTGCVLPSPPAATEWNSLAANNVIQQQTGPFCHCWRVISTSKVINVHDSPSASCIHGSHVVTIAARRTRHFLIAGHLTACDLHCSGATANHVTWSDRRPSYVARFRNLMPSLQTRRTAGMGYTVQYCSQDNKRASSDRGLVICTAVLLTAHSKHFVPHDLCLWLR